MLWSAMLAAAAAALAMRSPASGRLRAAGMEHRASAGSPGSQRSKVWTAPWFAAALAGFAVTRFVHGWQGLALAVVAAAVVHHWVGGLESAAERRRREEMVRALPFTVDLVIAALQVGRPPGTALGLAGEAVGGPLGEELAAVRARIDLGTDPTSLWREMAGHPVLAPLGRSFARAAQTGAPVTVVLTRCVDDLRRGRRAAAQQVARSVGVRTAAPLGACFLPAFVLVGVVPTIVGVFRTFVL